MAAAAPTIRPAQSCRYLLRPPFALGPAAHTADGQLRVHFKKPNRNGATNAQMSPERFLAGLCALVPVPGAHTVRYYSVLAPRHALRARVVPTSDAMNTEPKQLSLPAPQRHVELAANTGPALEQQLLDAAGHRLSWMSLLARVFSIDVSACQRCHGPMRVVRAVTCPDEIAAALHAARPPPRPSPPDKSFCSWPEHDSNPIPPSLARERVGTGAAYGHRTNDSLPLERLIRPSPLRSPSS